MSNKDLLDNIKKLRELTGVGFKDCKLALDELDGELLHETIDIVVSEFALDKQGLTKKEEPEEEKDD